MAQTKVAGKHICLLAVLVDIVMMGLILANLGLILFDWLFGMRLMQQVLSSFLPSFFTFYRDQIRVNFAEIDLAFVAVYLTEFNVQWLVAAWRKTYHRWFFYPFIHWYDLLGCIPVGDFRWLRVLRIFSILLRLQQLGWIDLRQTYVGNILVKYYQILIEEISDHVVVNVLEGVQREVAQGSPMLEKLNRNVLVPHKPAFVDLISSQVTSSVLQIHLQYRSQLERYLGHLTDATLASSSAGRSLRVLPFAQKVLRRQVQELGLALVDNLARDISAPENRKQMNSLLDSLLHLEGDKPLTPLLQEIVQDTIEQIKQQVAVQQWKLGNQENT
jgi:hypothetical protein